MRCKNAMIPLINVISTALRYLILQSMRNNLRQLLTHSPTFPPLHIRHSSISNPSIALPTSQHILQLFRCFTYVTAHSPTLLSLLLSHRLFTYVTWRASHGDMDSNDEDKISGQCTVEQATNISFTQMKERVAPMPSTS